MAGFQPIRRRPTRLAMVSTQMNDERTDGGQRNPVLTDEQRDAIATLASHNEYATQSKWTTFRQLPPADKWPYFRQHFLLGTALAVLVAVLATSVGVAYLTKGPEPELSVAGFGMGEYTDQLDALRDRFIGAAGIDDERLVDINGLYAIDLNGDTYMDDTMKLTAMITAGDINMVIADKATFAELDERGYVGAVSETEGEDATRRWADAGVLVDAQGEPVDAADADAVAGAKGFDLAHADVWTSVGGLPDGMIIGFCNVTDATRADRAREFIDFLQFA